jgi:hypothetical protein
VTVAERRAGEAGPPARRTGPIVLPIVGLALAAALGLVVWTSPGPAGVPASRSAPATAAEAVGADPAAPLLAARTSVAQGSHAGYRATMTSTRTERGARTVTVLDVELTTEGEPASAPSARAQLTGADGVKHEVPLTIIGAGHWVSSEFSIAAGKYRVDAQFDRQGGAVIIPMVIRLT